MDETIRAFIAISLDSKIQESIGQIQSELRKSGADVKWVKPKNIHLTLKFLGQTPVEKINSIEETMQAAVKSVTGFSFELSNLGAFPKIEKPKVIWLGSALEQKQIIDIFSNLEDGLVRLGFTEEDKKFKIHVTLGRVRSGLNRFALSKALKEHKTPESLVQFVNEIHLIKSTLTPQGPIYETLRTACLRSS